MSVTWAEIEGFWKFLKEDNVDMDAGEAEWRREQEKERERQEAAMKKMKNLPNDVRSKLGARFQEGQVSKKTLKSFLLELYRVSQKKCTFKILRAMMGGRNFGPLWAIQVLSEGLGHFGSLRAHFFGTPCRILCTL